MDNREQFEETDNQPMPETDAPQGERPFGELSDEIQRAVDDMGYTQATPIQAEAIPHILAGRDVMGQAQTGTGKTAAFGIPLIQSLRPKEKGVQAIVLCPTRELALQTAGELKKLARYRPGVRVLAVYGGAPISRQIQELNAGVTVVVGTPGRVIDHINRGTLHLDSVTMAVLDEADEMLDMGFRDDIESILGRTPSERQTLLFSATMPRPILNLARRYQRSPHVIEVEKHEMTVERIDQSYISIRSFHKGELLLRLIERDRPQRALVFMATKRAVDDVVTNLTTHGFAAGGLHGDMGQPERDAVMARFRTGALPILVATDVAARGLDVDNVEMVVNYDIPLAAEDYVHRIGRTGRAGKEGKAYTFVVGSEVRRMWEYRGITGAKILCEQPPSGEAVRKVRTQRLIEEARAALRGHGADDEKMLAAARTLLAEAADLARENEAENADDALSTSYAEGMAQDSGAENAEDTLGASFAEGMAQGSGAEDTLGASFAEGLTQGNDSAGNDSPASGAEALHEADAQGAVGGDASAARLVAALLKMMNKTGSRAGEDMDLTVPPPPRSPQGARAGGTAGRTGGGYGSGRGSSGGGYGYAGRNNSGGYGSGRSGSGGRYGRSPGNNSSSGSGGRGYGGGSGYGRGSDRYAPDKRSHDRHGADGSRRAPWDGDRED